MTRAPLVALSVLALAVSAIWWLSTGLLAGSVDSACADKLAADAAYIFSYVGFALAVGALVEAVRTEDHRIGWRLLAGYAALLGISVLISLNCAALA